MSGVCFGSSATISISACNEPVEMPVITPIPGRASSLPLLRLSVSNSPAPNAPHCPSPEQQHVAVGPVRRVVAPYRVADRTGHAIVESAGRRIGYIGLHVADERTDIAIDDMAVEAIDLEGQRSPLEQSDSEENERSDAKTPATTPQKIVHQLAPLRSNRREDARKIEQFNQPCAPNSFAIAVDIRKHSA